MERGRVIIWLILVLAIIAGAISIGGYLQIKSELANGKSENINLKINTFGNIKEEAYKPANITALQLLQLNNSVNATFSIYGAFVNCINEVCSTKDYYWMYYVDGVAATVSAGNYFVKSNDTIEFKYEKISM